MVNFSVISKLMKGALKQEGQRGGKEMAAEQDFGWQRVNP